MPCPSQKSRSTLDIGSVFLHFGFDGHTQVKDRYFVVVASESCSFLCFTASTQAYLTANPKFRTEVTPAIRARDECFPKDCVIDCRNLIPFDDVLLSSYLTSGRVKPVGALSLAGVAAILKTVQASRILALKDKRIVAEALRAILSPSIEAGPAVPRPDRTTGSA